MLVVTNLTKAYPVPRGPLRVLSDVSFSLAPGEAAAIVGPSGSGKSSLVHALGALDAPTSGTVTLDGRDPFVLPPEARADFRNRDVGFVFQDDCLLPQCSVIENVLVPTLVGAGGGEPDGAERRARALIARVGLAERIDHRPTQLSGAERQRAAVARALIHQPRLLLCDEPTGNLDAATAAALTSLLLDLHRDLRNILVVVTNSGAVAERFPIRYALESGRLTERSRG